MRRGFFLALLAAVLVSGPRRARANEDKPVDATPAPPWCASDLKSLPDDVCYFEGPAPASGRRTLVVFLHGVIDPTSTWQWAQQRGIVRGAQRLGFTVITPKGRRGLGPASMGDVIAWPTAVAAQEQVEKDLVGEWTEARRLLEVRMGKPFDEVFVVGFSSGAYYATSLAMRGRLDVDGYALFAGGSGRPHVRNAGAATSKRAPVFLSIAAKDRTTASDARGLAKVLSALHWPSRVEARPVGHAIPDEQLDHALAYLRAEAVRRQRH